MNMNINIALNWNMSRWRWGLAGALAVLTLVAAVQSTRTYQAHELTTGLIAVIGLAVLLLVGLASLGTARLRIAHELVALRGSGSGSALLAARQRRLEVVRAAGARPDPGILADATRADEAGRAYIGRYLVATAVLIGLVGTFAALMQTLGKMAPLFVDKDAGDVTSLVAPLAGLHVTFGASLVAILATLSLALASGDLTLCEEQALALLEDRTTHDLIPRLWPNTGDVAERTARAVEDLKTIFADTLGRSIEASLKGISESARAQTDRSARALEAVAATIEKEVARLCAAVEGTMEQGVARQGKALTQSVERQAGALAAATTAVGDRLGEAGSKLMAELRSEMEGTISRSAEAGRAALAAAVTATDAAIARSREAAEAATERSAGAVEQATVRSAAALEEAMGRSAATLEEATGRGAAAVEAATERSAAAVEELARLSASAIAESTARSATLLEESAQRTTRSAESLLRSATDATEKAAHATAEAVTRTLQPLFAEESARLEGVRGALADVGGQVDATAGRLVELTSSLDGLAREHIASIDRSGQAVLGAFDRAVLGGGAALDAAAGTLATAARDLQSGAQILAPRMGALATELGALGREVALLLASRGPDGDVGAVVLGELDRLGEGMERLTELVRSADARGMRVFVDPGVAGDAAGTTTPEATTAVVAVEAEPDAGVATDAADEAGAVSEVDADAEAEVVDSAEPSIPVVMVPQGQDDGLTGYSAEGDAAEAAGAVEAEGAVADAHVEDTADAGVVIEGENDKDDETSS